MHSQKLLNFSPLPIRLLLGIGFVFHGYIKLFTSIGHENFLRLLNEIGIPAAGFFAWLVGGVELFGGILLLLGLFTTVTSILLLVDMLVAMFWVTLPNGFDVMHVTVLIEAGPKFGVPGLEINLLYMAGLMSLLLSGAGAYSIDRYRSTIVAGNPLSGES
jgi:putative oxidoreductase